MKYILWFLRILVGLVFIFSGVVKANDPMGLVYKMNEVFEVWNMNFMIQYSLAFSVLLIAFEIMSGFAMIIGSFFRIWVTLFLLLNIFFTFLTAYALFSGKIKECGCFGDCIKISNEATFWKDVVLTAIAVMLFVYRNRVRPLFNKASINNALMVLVAIFAFGIQWWTLHHLPKHDCLAYKPGNNIWQKMQYAPNATPDVYETKFVYEKDGVKKEFNAENYPWQDSTWKFVSSENKLVKAGTGQPEIHDFSLTDSNGADVTQQVLSTKGYTFFWFVREPAKAHLDNIDRLHTLVDKANALHIPFYVLCSAGRDICNEYQKKWNLQGAPFLIIDLTVSKTAMRTNPGLMLLNNGNVVDKWSYLDYPKDMVLDNGILELKK